MSPIASRYSSPPAYDLTQLRYVRTIAECENMTAAARQLRVSQPTLSNAVRELESRLGTTLFLRGARGVVPTAAGKVLARTADEVFALLREGDEQMRGIESAPVGRFVVGSYHSFGTVFLPPLIKGLAVRAPGIQLSLWEGIGTSVVHAVVDRTVHFGVGVASAARPHPELVQVPLFRDVMAVVCARRRPARTAPLFHVPRVALSEKVFGAMRGRGELPERIVPCDDLELVKSLVLEGAGTGILPWRVARQGAAKGAIRLVDPALPFEVDVGCLFYRADMHRTCGALLLRDAIVQCGRGLDALLLPCGVQRIGRSPARDHLVAATRAPSLR
jgi:DNA-binding transcriptional LysR family regulator